MFPNDDICNIDAAKNAAQRLFRKYRSRGQSQEGTLGKNQINKLMKATYEAINMPYDPNQQDVFSFMGVFNSNNDGKLQLKDLEQMAVKYLCGTDSLLKQISLPSSTQISQTKVKIEQIKLEQSPRKEQKPAKVENIQKQSIRYEEKNKKRLTININDNEEIETPIHKIYTPAASNYKSPPLNSFYSPRQRISFKDNISLVNTQATSMKSQFNTPKQKLSESQIINKGRQIFNHYTSPTKKGLQQSFAGKVLTQTYELFGKKNFIPSLEDVKVWIKLCDKNKDSIVEWQDYQYFLKRTYERQIQKII